MTNYIIIVLPCANEQRVAILASMMIVYSGQNTAMFELRGGGGWSLISNPYIKFGSNRFTNDLIISPTGPNGHVAAILSAV